MRSKVSIRELHHRTGHFIRKAELGPILVTDRGRPIAEIWRVEVDLEPEAGVGLVEVPGSYWSNRKILPEFQKLLVRGELSKKRGDKSVDQILDDVKDDRLA